MVFAAFAGTGANADEDAAALFQENCSACHQADGSGIPGLAPPLTGEHFRKLLQERGYLPRVLAFGMTGQIRSGGAVFNGAMPAQSRLNDAQLTAVINYVAVDLNAAVLPPGWRPYEAAEISRARASPLGSYEQSRLRRKIFSP
jgi:mono/diheme cytochrome c family protein